MKNKFLFNVDDHFHISGGLVITPGVSLEDYEGSRYANLLLKKPNGSNRKSRNILFVSCSGRILI